MDESESVSELERVRELERVGELGASLPARVRGGTATPTPARSRAPRRRNLSRPPASLALARWPANVPATSPAPTPAASAHIRQSRWRARPRPV